MIIDIHCHIFPDAIAQKAAISISRFYGITMQMADGRLSTLLEAEDEAGIDRTLICSAATTARQTASINDFIAQTVAGHPDRFWGLGAMHQDTKDKAAEAERMLSLGLKGVKIHPDIQGVAINDRRFDELYEAMSGRMLLLAHTGDDRYDNSNPPQVLEVLKRFPRLTVIGAHLGSWSRWTEGVELLSGRENFYVDCSSSLYALTPEWALEVIRRYGAERVLFGSDFPMWRPKGELERLDRLSLTAAEREMICWKNAQALLG